jgi:phosphoglycerol transferase MdoB-like AlkP superfamily enzyme
LTLSNHAPFDLPEPLPFTRTGDMGELNKRMDGVRYADWAVGRFIEQAKKLDYFQNTVFVFVGDHGFHVDPKLGEVHLLYHHVPLLFYSPLLPKAGTVVSTPASQLDIVPSILGLLDAKAPQSSWGRNLFSTDWTNEEGGAVTFKGSGGSGSDQAMALIRGDKMLVVGSNGKTQLWKYRLNPDPAITPLDDPQSQLAAKTMQQELFGFVQAAANDLSSKTLTPPASLLHTIAVPSVR